jgi:serine/threonine protein kinase/WD40 repeat protein
MSEPNAGGPTPDDGHASEPTSEIPLPHRPESPPTDVINRGRARLLARLGDSTMQSELADSSTWKPPNPEVRDEQRYAFGEVLATGGLGLVRRGEDRRLGRPVAIKELLRDSPQAARRFALEAAITARLQHPGIVPLYDLGWQGEGKPYYCMQLVDGDSLEAKIASAIGLAERLRLVEHVIAVADAIAYAHERQIIHRDIKPANVLVGRFGETIVIDWGLAKDLSGTMLAALDGSHADAGADSSSDMTEAGTIMGTPRYMSPEQARGEAVDMRSDVYSLGALLYHVLAGEPPFAGGSRKDLLHRVLTGQLRPLADIEPAIPTELAAIAERAMDMRPEHRYPSAAALAEDLRSFQAGRLVSAHSYSLGQMLGRWLWRHRVGVGASVLSVLTLAAIATVLVVSNRRIQAETERAARLAFEHDVVAKAKLAGDVVALARTPGRELEALARGVEAVGPYGPDYEQAPDVAILGLSQALGGMIPVMRLDGRIQEGLTRLSVDGSKLVRSSSTELEVWSLGTARKLTGIPLGDPDFNAVSLALSLDNRLVAISNQRRCVIFDLESGMRVLEFDECGDPKFATDGGSLVAKVPRDENPDKRPVKYEALTVWELASSTQRWTTPIPGSDFVTIVHPDGERLIVGREGEVEILSVKTGEHRASLARALAQPRLHFSGPGIFAWGVGLSPDGRSLVVAESEDGKSTVLWNLESEAATVLDLPSTRHSRPVFSADGRWLLVGGGPPVQAYDLEQHTSTTSLPTFGFVVGHRTGGLTIADNRWIELPRGRSIQSAPADRLRELQATLDGRFVITLTDTDTRVWSVEEHLALERWTPLPGEVIRQFRADYILTDDKAGVWRIHARTDPSRTPLIVQAKLEKVFRHVNGEPLIGGGVGGRPLIVAIDSGEDGIEIRDLATGELRCTILPHERRRVSLSDDGQALAYSDKQGRAHVWDLDPCRERAIVHLFDPTTKVAEDIEPFHFAPDGTFVVYNQKGRGRITLLDPRGQEAHFDEECPKPSWAGYAVSSPDGRMLMSSCDSSQYHRHRGRLWDVARGESIAELDLHDYSTMPAFSSDGKLLIFGAGGYELAVVRVEDGREILRVPTREIQTQFPQMRVRAGLPVVDVLTVEGELVSYPISRAHLVDAACRILGRSELAPEVSPWCEGAQPTPR